MLNKYSTINISDGNFNMEEFIGVMLKSGVTITKEQKLCDVYIKDEQDNFSIRKKICDVISVKPDSKVVVIINKV